MVGLLEEAGVELHLAGQHWPQLGGHVIPGRDLVVAFGQLRVCGHDAQFLLSGNDLLAQRVPPAVEFALVLVRPRLGHVVRRVRGTGGPIHEERLVRHQRLLLAHPGDGAVGEIFGQRVALLGDFGGSIGEVPS